MMAIMPAKQIGIGHANLGAFVKRLKEIYPPKLMNLRFFAMQSPMMQVGGEWDPIVLVAQYVQFHSMIAYPGNEMGVPQAASSAAHGIGEQILGMEKDPEKRILIGIHGGLVRADGLCHLFMDLRVVKRKGDWDAWAG